MPYHTGEFVTILITIFWFWMLVDCIANKRLNTTEKAFWVLFMLFTHIVGAGVYFLVGRKKNNAFSFTYHSVYQPPQTSQPDSQNSSSTDSIITQNTSEDPYASYEAGYRTPTPVYKPVEYSPPEQEYERTPADQYEQPQAMYPEQRQEP